MNSRRLSNEITGVSMNNKKDDAVNSHIQMPKCVLAEFVNGNKSFYKYNVENGKINIGYPKRTFTSENYYSGAMETALNKHIESPLKNSFGFCKWV